MQFEKRDGGESSAQLHEGVEVPTSKEVIIESVPVIAQVNNGNVACMFGDMKKYGFKAGEV